MAAMGEGKINVIVRIKREQGKKLKICKAKHYSRFRLKEKLFETVSLPSLPFPYLFIFFFLKTRKIGSVGRR